MTSEQIILTADDFRALGGDPEAPKPIKVLPRQAILPIALTGEYAGKFALCPTVDVPERIAEILNRLPRAVIADSDRKWVAEEIEANAQKDTPK